MAKYSFEFKKQIVNEYLQGNGGAKYLAKKHGIPNEASVKQWIKNYIAYGDDGLFRSRQNKKYSFEYKLSVVELYLSSELSVRELAVTKEINNPAIISKWVNDFRIAGPDALKPKKKGRKKSLKSLETKKNTTSEKTVSVNTSAEHIKQLEDELLKLRIENAYLKELRRLRLEEETLLKEQRELSTVSEEISN